MRFLIFDLGKKSRCYGFCEYNPGFVAIEMRLGKIANDERTTVDSSISGQQPNQQP